MQPDGKVVVLGDPNGFDLTVYRYLPNGQPDPSFGSNGKVVHENMFAPAAMDLQSDGRIVAGGERNGYFHLARLTPTGELDSSFDGDGLVEDFDSGLHTFGDILVQRDGKIVVCGSHTGGDFSVVRYDANGARDNFFDGDGKVTIGFGEFDFCHDIAQQDDAKLVVVGMRLDYNEDVDFAVARLEPSGLLDTDDGDGGFDGDGKLTTSFGGNASARAVALQPDGKIVVLGNYYTLDTSFLARYKTDGSLDSTFGTEGKLTIPVDYLNDLEILPDGKILTLGTHQSPDGDFKFAFRQFLPNGSPDTSFGLDGVFWPDFGGYDQGAALALQPDGRIVAAGRGGTGGVVIRLWPDTAFDSGGQQVHRLVVPDYYPPGADTIARTSVVQPDGKILVAGELLDQGITRSDAFVARFLPDGQIDTSFGEQGMASVWAGRFNSANAIAVQPDGKIIIAGWADYTVGWVEFMVARFHPNGEKDTSFGDNGGNYRIVNFSTGPSTDYGYALALAPDGKIVVAGRIWNGSAFDWGIARWNSDGTPDNTFDGDGKAIVDFGENNSAQAVVVQPDHKIIVAGTSDGNFAFQRLLENGAPDPDYGLNGGGYNITDMGALDSIHALVLAPDGWLYAAGTTWDSGIGNFALAQYGPDGILAQCEAGQSCDHWPDGRRYVNIGGPDLAYAAVLRGDDQLVVAGCSDGHMAAAQVSTTDISAQPLLFGTDFVGSFDCAYAVQFSDANRDKIVLAGTQVYNLDRSIALARFETTPDGTVPPPPPPPPPPGTDYQTFVPIILR